MENTATDQLLGSMLKFRLIAVESASRGVFQDGTTSVYITSTKFSGSNAHAELNNAFDYLADDGELEIDEGFLGNSVLLPIPHSRPVEYECEVGTKISFTWETTRKDQSSMEWPCSAASLTSPVSRLADDHCIYIRTSDLGSIGILNGDWVCLCDLHFRCQLD